MSLSQSSRCEIWPVPPVPFTDTLEIDFDALDGLTDFYQQSGVDGLFLLALSGEGLEQTYHQCLAVCRHVVRRTAGRLRLVTGGNFRGDLLEQIGHINQLAETGPDAVVIMLSTLPRRDRLVEDLLQIAQHTAEVTLPLYECPYPEHRLLSADDVRRLAETRRFVFMKETSRNRQQYRGKLEAAHGTPMKVFQANLGQLSGSLEDGCPGFCGIIANVCPRLTDAYCNDPGLSEPVRQKLHSTLSKILQLMTQRYYPASMKYLLSLQGLEINTRSLMAGGETIDSEGKQRLRMAVEALGLWQRPEDFLRELLSLATAEQHLSGPHSLKGPSAVRAAPTESQNQPTVVAKGNSSGNRSRP